MSNQSQQIGTSLLSIEANVIIAGLEGIALGWVLCATGASREIWLPGDFGSTWSSAVYAVYGVYALLAILIVGFIIEGLAGIVEENVVSRLSCYKSTIPPEEHQQNIWKSDQAHKDFSRRRLRILVARNTAFCFAILCLGLLAIFAVKCNVLAMVLTLVVGSGVSALFTYLWIDARRGLKNDIESAGKITNTKQGA